MKKKGFGQVRTNDRSAFLRLTLFFSFSIILSVFTFGAGGKDLITIEADYLLYSYDYNYIYGKGNVRLTLGDYAISADTLEMDINDRNALLSRNGQVVSGKTLYNGDCVDLEFEKIRVRIRTFGEKIQSVILPSSEASSPFIEFIPVSFQELKSSFAYFIGKKFVIKKSFSVYGYLTTAYLEGMQSVSVRKVRIDKGAPEKQQKMFGVNKIWYYSSQGLVFNGAFNLDKKIKKNSYTNTTTLETQYDIFRAIGITPRGRAYMNSKQTLEFSKNFNVNLNLSWITQNMIQGSLIANHRLKDFLTSELQIDYNKPYLQREEMWFRWRSNFMLKSWGNLFLNFSYEKIGQNILDLSYSNQLFKKLNVSLRHNQSKLMFDNEVNNKLANSGVSLSYSTRIFNLSADYSLNRDLLHDQTQANPTLRLQFTPFTLYGGLLRFNVMSTSMLNYMRKGAVRDSIFRNNSAVNLETEKFFLTQGTEFSLSMSLEQFIDKDPQNQYTSLGYIFRGKQKLWELADLEFLYNYQTRRETTHWFLQGTHSQDWNMILRLNEKKNQRVTGWTSLTMDTKRGQLTTGFLDLTVFLIKNWRIQSQLNYDFIFKKLHYDLYLMRKAGRFILRLSYRSLSKQFLFEILPQ